MIDPPSSLEAIDEFRHLYGLDCNIELVYQPTGPEVVVTRRSIFGTITIDRQQVRP